LVGQLDEHVRAEPARRDQRPEGVKVLDDPVDKRFCYLAGRRGHERGRLPLEVSP